VIEPSADSTPSTGSVDTAFAKLILKVSGNAVKHKLANNTAIRGKTENLTVPLIMSVPKMNNETMYLGFFDQTNTHAFSISQKSEIE
jgi:hypothetical protein